VTVSTRLTSQLVCYSFSATASRPASETVYRNASIKVLCPFGALHGYWSVNGHYAERVVVSLLTSIVSTARPQRAF